MLGGGCGVILHSIQTIRNNRKLLRKKNRFKKERSFLNLKGKTSANRKAGITHEHVSKKFLQKIKFKIEEQQRKYNIRFGIFLILTLPLLIYGCVYLFDNYRFFLFAEKKIEATDLTKKYYFFIDDGDQWLSKRKYHNAIFQYKKALELFPSDYEANYRLALAYSFRCDYEFKDCEEGKVQITKIARWFPDKPEVHELDLILFGTNQ